MHCRRLRRGTGGLRRAPPGPDDSGHQPAGRRRLRVVPHPADRIGRPGAVSLGAGRRRGQAVWAGTWRGRLSDQAVPDAGAAFARAAPFAARLPHRAAPQPGADAGGLHGQFAGRRRPPRDGTTLALTATERALLQRLADDRGHIVTYDAVCEAVWGADYYGYENSLNVHIRHLREKIEPDPGHPQWLLTVRGIGYRLTGEV